MVVNDIKSQDDLGQRGRSVDVLTSTIDELAKVKKQLEIALSSMRDSRELFYQLSQITVADAIGKQLEDIKELDK